MTRKKGDEGYEWDDRRVAQRTRPTSPNGPSGLILGTYKLDFVHFI